jgi:hypothetical protein
VYEDERQAADEEHGEGFDGVSAQHEAIGSGPGQAADRSRQFLAERRSSPAKTSLRQSRINLSNSRPRKAPDTPERDGTPHARRTTPPKTPHLPGFYHSSTPYQVSPAPPSHGRHLAEEYPFSLQTPLPTQSRTTGEPSLFLSVVQTPAPRVPGAYSSPFPHPKRAEASASSGSPEFHAGSGQQERHNLHASTRLEQIVEGDEIATEQSDRTATPARVERTSPARKSTTPKGTPTRVGRSLLGSSRAPPATQPPPSPSSGRQSSPLQRVKAKQHQISDTPLDKVPSVVTPQPSPAKRTRSESTESVMHSLLSELAKPLGYLLGTSTTPPRAGTLEAEPARPEENVATGFAPAERAYGDALTETEKGSRKVSHSVFTGLLRWN